MTPGQVYEEYLKIEREANKILVGADPEVIIAILAEEISMPVADVTAIVLKFTATRSGG